VTLKSNYGREKGFARMEVCRFLQRQKAL